MPENFKDAFLLDRNPPEVLMCAQCKVDQKINVDKLHTAGWGTSDGICVEHFTKMLKTAGMSPLDIKSAVEKVAIKYPGKTLPRYLEDPKNKQFLDWLENPTPAPKSTKTS